MATLTVYAVPEEVVDSLKESAKRNKRSMEQEVRELLRSRFPVRVTVRLPT